MAHQGKVEELLSVPRLESYLLDADGDLELAWSTYIWANNLAGALHSLIALFEVALRNSLDRELQRWNRSQSRPGEWAAGSNAAQPLYSLLKSELKRARNAAESAASRRPAGHPRQGHSPTHDDVVAHLMLGAWEKLLQPLSSTETVDRQQQLWTDGLKNAFPGVDRGDAGRIKCGQTLARIRQLRNRVAHHDNLLGVNAKARSDDMIAVLTYVDSAYLDLVFAAVKQVRNVRAADPRKPAK